MAPIALQVTRAGFSVLGRVSPTLAGKAAFRLFCHTPSRRVHSEKERTVLAAASRRMETATRADLTVPGGTIASYRFPAAERNGPQDDVAGPVLVVHGWASRSEHMMAVIDGIRQSGRDVVAIDLPGHGRSSGRTLNLPMGVRAIDAAWRHYGPFGAMVGHSFGGVVVLNAAQGSVAGIGARRPDRLALIAAPASIPGLFATVAGWLGISGRARQVFEGEVQRLTGRPLARFDGASQLSEVSVPTLIVHARDDKEVASESAETYASAGPHVRLHWADGLGHRRIIGARPVARLIGSFVHEPAGDHGTSPAAARGTGPVPGTGVQTTWQPPRISNYY
jgi:pimeloyl-ACP methyl ester carboxylesterase